jgi:hypothetical protein
MLQHVYTSCPADSIFRYSSTSEVMARVPGPAGKWWLDQCLVLLILASLLCGAPSFSGAVGQERAEVIAEAERMRKDAEKLRIRKDYNAALELYQQVLFKYTEQSQTPQQPVPAWLRLMLVPRICTLTRQLLLLPHASLSFVDHRRCSPSTRPIPKDIGGSAVSSSKTRSPTRPCASCGEPWIWRASRAESPCRTCSSSPPSAHASQARAQHEHRQACLPAQLPAAAVAAAQRARLSVIRHWGLCSSTLGWHWERQVRLTSRWWPLANRFSAARMRVPSPTSRLRVEG